MELILIVVMVTSVLINLLTIRAFKKFQRHPIEVELLPVLESTGCNCNCGVEVKEVPIPSLEKEPVKAPPDDSYKAWKNRVEEPTVAPPSPHGPPPKSEPLARPYGFSR